MAGSSTKFSARILIERFAATLILLLIAVWLGVNLVKSPSQFFQSSVIGLSNGVLYALIALGYKPQEAARAISAAQGDDVATSEELIRRALAAEVTDIVEGLGRHRQAVGVRGKHRASVRGEAERGRSGER